MVDLLLHNVEGITDIKLLEQALVVLFTLLRTPSAPFKSRLST